MDLINKVGIVVQKYCRSLVPMNPIPAKYLLAHFKYRSGTLSYNCLPTPNVTDYGADDGAVNGGGV